MADMEHTWDKLLHIKTTGRDDSRADQYRYPYEPTPYCVLERFANSGFSGALENQKSAVSGKKQNL